MGKVQKKLNIKRDVQFHFLSPITSLIASIFIILFVYLSFAPLISELNRFDSSLFFLGATVGISIVFMGMIVIFTRKQTLTNIVGYLTMENGVVLFSLFLTELPLLIEILIIIDLIMLTLIATILAFGIDSTIEEFHARLNPFAQPKRSDSKDSLRRKPNDTPLNMILALYALIGAVITVLTVFSKSHKTHEHLSSDSSCKLSGINTCTLSWQLRFPLTD